MNVCQMLEQVARRYAVQEGPISRQRDAAALLRLAPALDEESARTYLERFITKWRIEQPGAKPLARHAPLIRRRPMPELERRVHMELALGAPRGEQPIVITMDTPEDVSQHGGQ